MTPRRHLALVTSCVCLVVAGVLVIVELPRVAGREGVIVIALLLLLGAWSWLVIDA